MKKVIQQEGKSTSQHQCDVVVTD